MWVAKKKKSFPFLIQIISILLIGALVSVGVFFYIQDKNATRHTVTFAYQDGTVIEKRTVKDGCGLIPSVPEHEGSVFQGWSTTLNNVTNDMEAHPCFYRIIEQNLFYFNSVYVREGRKFKIDLMLDGDVNISKGKLVLKYDDEVFDFKSYTGENLTTIKENKPGELIISFSSEKPLTSKTKLAEIEFYAEKKDVKYSEITLSAKGKEMFLVVDGKDKIADCATINNKIYFIQEVGE